MDEVNFYAFTADSVGALLRRVAERAYELCCTPGKDFSVFERAPGLYCTGRITTAGYRLLEFRQVPKFIETDAYAKCLEEPTAAQCLACLDALHTVSKQVTVHVALGFAPTEDIPGLPQGLLRAWRANEQTRINPKKPYLLPWSDEEWHPKVIVQHAKREPYGWRTICIEPDKQTPEDVCFQLGLILLQEQMIPEAEINKFTDAMVKYLCEQPGGCADISTARLVLDRLQRYFTAPENWRALRNYVSLYLYWEGRKEKPGRSFNERRKGTGEEATLIAVEAALAQFVAERLPATRSTLFRWAQDWAMKTPGLAVSVGRRLWLTSAGIDQAREKLLLKVLAKLQIKLGKEKEAARKFIYRHKLYIQEALARGDRVEDIAKALLSQAIHENSKEMGSV